MFAPVKGVGWCIGTKQRKSTNVFGSRSLGIFKDTVIDNVCPHRGALFSQGPGVDSEGFIQCPYHGWKYNKKGNLVEVPSCTSAVPLSADIRSYETDSLYDFVWTTFDDTMSPLAPCIPEIDSNEWAHVSSDIELDGNWLKWVENSCDISHINFVHDFADEKNGKVHDMRITEETPGHVTCEARVYPKATSVYTQHMQVETSKIKLTFYYPNTTVIHIKLKGPYEFITYTTVTPLGANRTLMTWCFAYKSYMDNFIVRNHLFEQIIKTILEDEQIIKNIPIGFENKVNVPVDMLSQKVMKNIQEMIKSDPKAVPLR